MKRIWIASELVESKIERNIVHYGDDNMKYANHNHVERRFDRLQLL